MKLIVAGLVLSLLAVISHAAPRVKPRIVEALADAPNYRLNRDVLPSFYNLELKPYLNKDEDGAKAFKFDGEVYITIRAQVSTNSIILHSKNLNYTVVELYSESNPNVTVNINNRVIDPVTDKMTLSLTSNLLTSQNYVLHFKFIGSMDDDMHGFYKSSYVDDAGNERWLGSTQFETNHARRAFPCFDEPQFKAVFRVHMNRHKSFSCYSNSRLSSSNLTPEGNRYIDTFKDSPKMSTYLLAFLVSPFKDRNDGDFYVIARPELYDQTLYAFNVGPKLLEGFDNYTNLKYYDLGNDKMAMAGIPDFSAGAMENWGLLTYRERAVLFANGSSTLSAKQSIAGVIAHEQAHMWFGDLVTCDWWSYTWLNEGFARYFQYFMTHEIHPELQMDQQFPVDQIQSVMNMDSTNNTNPMTDPNVNSPADLSRMFNSISYNKGAAIIRMTKHAMGEANFQKSLQNYLNEFKFQTTVPENLFKHWRQNWPSNSSLTAAQLNTYFADWTEQVGYPVLHVNASADRKSINVKQERFLLKANDGADSSLSYIVPLTYTTNATNNFSATNPSVYLLKDSVTTAAIINFEKPFSWVILNIQQTGYYRVNYDTRSWHQIHHALYGKNWSGIHELNRAQIADDLLNLARAGTIKYDLAFNILEYLETELNFLPWTAALSGFSHLAIRMGTDRSNFSNFILDTTDKVYNTLGFEERKNDTTLDIYNRNKIISWACLHGNKDCVTKAQNIFKQLSNEGKSIPENIRNAVYCTSMREGTAADFDFLYQKFLHETVPTEQTLLISVLGCVKEPKLVERYFDIIISENIRRQDKSSAITSLYSENVENVSPVFALVDQKHEALAEAMGGYSSVATVISNIANRFTTAEQKKSLEDFNARNGQKFGSSVATLERAVKNVEENLDWSEKNLPSLRFYLSSRHNGAATTSISLFSVLFVAVCSYLISQ